jgi:hypothetical protein
VLRIPVLAFAFAVALAACGHKGSARLEGRWKGMKAEGVAPEAQARANDFATQTELDVKGDTITITFPKDKQSGRYKVLSESKSMVVIVTDKDGESDKQTFTFVDDKTMKWMVLEGKTITFAKQ